MFGTVYGWERPNWFAPPGYALSEADLAKPDVLLNENHPAPAPGEPIREKWSFRRSNYFPFVGEECRQCPRPCRPAGHVGLRQGLCRGPRRRGVARFDPRQPHPEEDRPHRRSAISCPPNGGVRVRVHGLPHRAATSFYLVSAGALERHDHDILQKLLPADGSVRFQPVTTAVRRVRARRAAIARRSSRALTDTDLSNEAFPWLTGKTISVGPTQAYALRVNFVGELGFELHHPIEMQNALFDLLWEAGKPFGLRPFGIRAMMAMAVEKSYRLIGRELSIEYSAFESGLDRFVHPNKGGFLGRDALVDMARARLQPTAS